MDHLEVRNSSSQVAAEIVITFVVLAAPAVSYTVRQGGFENVIFLAGQIGVCVEHNAGHLLANTLAHEMRFPRIDLEAFLQGDAASMNMESPRSTLQSLVA